MHRVALLLTVGLLAACGNSSSTASGNIEDAADNQGDAIALAETANATEPDTINMSSPLGSGTAQAPDETIASENASRKAESVTTLPLKPGFYVVNDTTCGQASNATLMLVRKSGINTSRVPCDFKSIEKTSTNSYRVTESCTEGGAAWGTEEHISTNVSTYEIPNETSFNLKSDSGWESSARYCPQSSLPEPWRNNDIGDLIE